MKTHKYVYIKKYTAQKINTQANNNKIKLTKNVA